LRKVKEGGEGWVAKVKVVVERLKDPGNWRRKRNMTGVRKRGWTDPAESFKWWEKHTPKLPAKKKSIEQKGKRRDIRMVKNPEKNEPKTM